MTAASWNVCRVPSSPVSLTPIASPAGTYSWLLHFRPQPPPLQWVPAGFIVERTFDTIHGASAVDSFGKTLGRDANAVAMYLWTRNDYEKNGRRKQAESSPKQAACWRIHIDSAFGWYLHHSHPSGDDAVAPGPRQAKCHQRGVQQQR